MSGPNTREYNKQYYAKNREKRKAQIRSANLRAIAKNKDNLRELLQESSCADCGTTDWRVLEFDHQRDKTHSIGAMITSAFSWERIQEEIEKCDIVCANCHRIRTGEQFATWRYAPV